MRKAMNPNQGWQTAGRNQLNCSTLGSRYHGSKCGNCVHSKNCQQTKNIPDNSDYCHWPSNMRKFELNTSGLTQIYGSKDSINSKKAALLLDQRGTRKSHIRIIYLALLKHPGKTYKELSIPTGLTESQVEKRLSDLKNDGWIFQSGERAGCGLWWPREWRLAA